MIPGKASLGSPEDHQLLSVFRLQPISGWFTHTRTRWRKPKASWYATRLISFPPSTASPSSAGSRSKPPPRVGWRLPATLEMRVHFIEQPKFCQPNFIYLESRSRALVTGFRSIHWRLSWQLFSAQPSTQHEQ